MGAEFGSTARDDAVAVLVEDMKDFENASFFNIFSTLLHFSVHEEKELLEIDLTCEARGAGMLMTLVSPVELVKCRNSLGFERVSIFQRAGASSRIC